MIWYLPIQPFDERYTEQWYRMFPAEFNAQGLEYQLIPGEALTSEIKVGTFLDCNGSLFYQASQLRQVARFFNEGLVKDGDVFFVADVEFWGIESIRYLAKLNGIKIQLCGFCHAGSYTTEDFFAKCEPFAQGYELLWREIFDKIFVGSRYHKYKLAEKRRIPAEKIFVTGNPYDFEGVLSQIGAIKRKEDRVICTNRPDPEKRPDITLKVFEYMKLAHPDWEFMVTTSRKQWGTGQIRDTAIELQRRGIITIKEGISKLEYLTLLAESKVMTGNSIEENFGYCILESLMVNTIPIIEKNYSHPELVNNDGRCLFVNPDHQRVLITKAVYDPFAVYHCTARYRSSLPLIVEHLKDSTDKPGELL